MRVVKADRWDGIPRPGESALRASVAILLAALVVAGSTTRVGTSKSVAGPVPYGPGIAADGLANTQVGGTSCGCPNLVSSFRFRAGQSSALAAIRLYIIKGRQGYSGGTGGSLTISVRPDDGSPDHRPLANALASTTVVPQDGFPRYVFAAPASLTAGELYHLVFVNTDQAPTLNFVSVNALHVAGPAGHPRQARFADTDWAQLIDDGSGWHLRPDYTPILQLDYASGASEGLGYMEVWVASAKTISGSAQARERFTVSGGDRSISSVSVRLNRRSGSSPLTVRLEAGSGEVLVTGAVPAEAIGQLPPGVDGGSWATVVFDWPRVLRDGQTYDVVLSSPADTAYSIAVIRKGSAFGFAPTTYFADGSAQYNPGGGWVAFDPGWRGPLDEGDLQLVFR
jgi:hypothetical protein